MLNKINNFIEKLLSLNFPDSIYKYTFLYNELLISIFINNTFVLFWVNYKVNSILINYYSWNKTIYWKKLMLLLLKYEELFYKILKNWNKQLSNLREESDFINIFDKNEYNLFDIDLRLSYTFLDDYAWRRQIQEEFYFDEKVLSIYHSDFECSKCYWPIKSFNTFTNHQKLIEESIEDEDNGSDFLYTNINDYESITVWWNDKISEIISDKKLLNNYDIVKLDKTCISVIMWDDLTSIIKYNKLNKNKMIYMDQNIDSPYRAVINYLKNIFINETKKNNETIFFGLNKEKNTFEIIEFLYVNFWIKVWSILLPHINVNDLENILNYKLAVFFTWREVKAQSVFKLYPIDNIELTIPYGLTNMYNFYKNVLRKYWKDNEISIVQDYINNLKSTNISLFEKSKWLWIGFVIFDFHIKYFLEDNFRGVPILSLLEDMWFNINFFIFKNSNKYALDIEKFRNMWFNILFSQDKKKLDNFISSENTQLFYSEISNDLRILSKHKQQFSIWDLEYWIEGFFRTFKLLINKCEKVKYIEKNFVYYLNK